MPEDGVWLGGTSARTHSGPIDNLRANHREVQAKTKEDQQVYSSLISFVRIRVMKFCTNRVTETNEAAATTSFPITPHSRKHTPTQKKHALITTTTKTTNLT